MSYLYVVSTKKGLITVRIAQPDLAAFKTAAKLRGSTMSGLVHQFVYRVIREEKTENPAAFEMKPKHKAPVVAAFSGKPTKEQIRRDFEKIVAVQDEGTIGKRAAKRKAK